MARHRKRPAPRQQARGRDDSPASPEASEGRFGAAMRRVVVTPTFAAGLGVVVAALLAYPMQTVFSYVAPGAGGRGGADGGLLCAKGGCGHQLAPGNPAPFGVGGGTLSPSPPGPAEPGNDGPQASAVPQPGGGAGGARGGERGAPARPPAGALLQAPGQGGGRLGGGGLLPVPGGGAGGGAAAPRLPPPPHPGHEPRQPPRAERARCGGAVQRL